MVQPSGVSDHGATIRGGWSWCNHQGWVIMVQPSGVGDHGATIRGGDHGATIRGG